MYRNCCLFISILISCGLSAQYFKVSGKITNDRLEPLPLVSIQVKEFQSGILTKEDGTYELKLEEREYDLVVSMIGYKTQIIRLAVTKDYVQNIIMEEEKVNLSEVVVRSKLRSEEIIRNVIRHKDNIMASSGAYSCDAYIKATQEDSSRHKVKKTKKAADSILKADPNADLQRMSMIEILLRFDYETSTRIKEVRTGVVKRGKPENLFYLSLTEGDFNLYNNLLRSRVLSEVPFISPVSYSGLTAYKYKITGTKKSGHNKLYTISVKPRQISNVTIEGELTIVDSLWVIVKAKFVLPSYHIPEYDYFEINQEYNFINNKAWMINRQEFTYFSKHNKAKISGKTIVDYTNFEFNKTFPAKWFGEEVSATSQDAYERDSSFWNKTRVEPLTVKEIRFIHYRDSIFRATHTKTYLDSIDKLINRITWKKALIFGQTFYNREKERSWYIPPIAGLYQPFHFGGARIQPGFGYSKIYKSKKRISISGDISYGLRNRDVNGNFRIMKMYNPFNRGFYRIEGGRNFQYIFEGDAWINMIKRSNQYLNNFIGLGHGLEIANGVFLYTDFDLAFRRSLSSYKTNSEVDSLFGNWLDDNQALSFEPYNAVYGRVKVAYTPQMRYIREPKEKIILGSKWPTFYTEWRKGIPGLMNSKVNFDYLEFGIEQQLKLGTVGVLKYYLKTGSFINTRKLEVIDYKFQRRGDPLLFMNPNEAFQALDSTFPVFKRFYQGHFIHEFNGAIINKIPFLKKLQLREVFGGGFLIAPERNLRYVEAFAGVERVLKWPFDPLSKFKMGVYVISSAANKFSNPVQFKIGFTAWDKKRNRWH